MMGDNVHPRPIYRETQTFSRIWLLLAVPSTLVPVSLFMYGIVKQIVYGVHWGRRPMSDQMLVMSAIFVAAICLGILFIIAAGKLVTEVRSDGLYVKFFPMHLRFHRIDLDAAKEISVAPKGTIGRYYGEGIKLGRNGRSYIASGREGVSVSYGSTGITIGSHDAAGLLEAINSVISKK